MGFALWVEGEQAWAQGTHEYRPMGVAVIGVGGQFAARDFARGRTAPGRMDPRFVGLFASLGEMNDWIGKRRKRKGRSHELKIYFRAKPNRVVSEF